MNPSQPKNKQISRLEHTLKRLHAQVLLSWEKEKRLLSWYGLHDGMSVLEVGSGPGFFTSQLLTAFPTSPITCIDTNAVFLAQARHLLPVEALPRIHFVEADILTNDLPEQAFDVAIARFVFQHLASPVAAAQAIWRALKPGGKLIIIDVDDALFGIIHPPIPELSPALQAYEQAQVRREGDRHIGRHLWRILKQAHFLPLALDTVTFHSDELGIEAFRKHLDPERFVPLVEAGFLSHDEFARACAGASRFFTSPEHFVLMLWFIACGQKPALVEYEKQRTTAIQLEKQKGQGNDNTL